MLAYETVVGLEVHIQMNTQSKAFCADALSFGAEPNTHVSTISLAHPGTLPVANDQHIKNALSLGLALGCKINKTSMFDRKHYYYADLPKAYQITQDRLPICQGGSLKINTLSGEKEIKIHHVHMEEDAGKTIHDIDESYSLVDLNRAGTPLLELVTEPNLSSGEEVLAFIAGLQQLVRYLGISDGDMEKGSLRCDVNVSVRPKGSDILSERCEIKNVNSKKFAKTAVEYESTRQIELIRQGFVISKKTLHFDPVTGQTSPMREKEDADDYRYFPDPDLPPIVISDEELKEIRSKQPALPWEVKNRMKNEFQLSEYDSSLLSEDKVIADYFFRLVKKVNEPKLLANLITNKILPEISTDGIKDLNKRDDQVIDFIELIKENKVGKSIAYQKLWPEIIDNSHEEKVTAIAERMGIILRADEDFIIEMIKEVLSENAVQAEEYRQGKKKVFGFLVGQAMRKSKGAVAPDAVRKALMEVLET